MRFPLIHFNDPVEVGFSIKSAAFDLPFNQLVIRRINILIERRGNLLYLKWRQEPVIDAFFQGVDVLGGIWITDESALRDFAGCGAECDDYPVELRKFRLRHPEQVKLWCRWVTQKVFTRYGIEIPGDTRILLVDLFRQIKTLHPMKIQ